MTEQAIEPQGMSEAGRVTGIFWEPRPVFENLAQRPRFWVPLLILTAFAVVYMATFSRVVGWETMFRQQFASNPRMEQMTPEQRDQALQMTTKIVGPMTTVMAVAAPAGWGCWWSRRFSWAVSICWAERGSSSARRSALRVIPRSPPSSRPSGPSR